MVWSCIYTELEEKVSSLEQEIKSYQERERATVAEGVYTSVVTCDFSISV